MAEKIERYMSGAERRRRPVMSGSAEVKHKHERDVQESSTPKKEPATTANEAPKDLSDLAITSKPATIKCLSDGEIPNNLKEFTKLATSDMASVFMWARTAKARLQRYE